MKIIGLTGNIGSGKSIVAAVFSHLGVPVYHADHEARKLYGLPEVKEAIISTFGEVYLPDGTLDRRALASIVFGDPARIAQLNALLHPMVKKDFRHWIHQQKNQAYIIQEAAIIFESGFRNEFHKIIDVSCPPDIAYKRVMKRDGITEEMVLQRSQYQMDEKQKAALSDFVILNDGFQPLLPQIIPIHQQILEIAS